MILVAVVDDRMGLCFHVKRQSQDKGLREKILTLFAGKTLWMNEYSAKQFAKDAGADAICVAEDFLTQAGKGEICFVENISAASAAERVEQVYLFHWNRAYPGDLFFDLPLEDGWELTLEEEFSGSSHENITLEVYERA